MRKKVFYIYTGLILTVVAAIVWSGFSFTQNSQAVADKSPQTTNKEAMNINKLNDLLRSDGARVDDNALLPAQIEQSKTMQVRLQSAGEQDFSEQMAETADVSLLGVKNNAGALARQRFIELSPTLILIVAVNDQKQVLWWHLQPDPRVFRADTVTAERNVIGKTLYRNDADMLVSIPADERISQLRFYHPVWDGKSSYSLSLVGSLDVINTQTEVNK